jgi:hypothetical protein
MLTDARNPVLEHSPRGNAPTQAKANILRVLTDAQKREIDSRITSRDPEFQDMNLLTSQVKDALTAIAGAAP